MAGLVKGQLILTSFQETYVGHKPVPESLVELLARMAS